MTSGVCFLNGNLNHSLLTVRLSGNSLGMSFGRDKPLFQSGDNATFCAMCTNRIIIIFLFVIVTVAPNKYNIFIYHRLSAAGSS